MCVFFLVTLPINDIKKIAKFRAPNLRHIYKIFLKSTSIITQKLNLFKKRKKKNK